jgi:hypothetical protein
MKLSVSLVLTTAAALNEDLRLEIVADALDIVAYVVAVFLRREPSSHPFPRVNTQPIALNTRLAFILAVLSTNSAAQNELADRRGESRADLVQGVTLEKYLGEVRPQPFGIGRLTAEADIAVGTDHIQTCTPSSIAVV